MRPRERKCEACRQGAGPRRGGLAAYGGRGYFHLACIRKDMRSGDFFKRAEMRRMGFSRADTDEELKRGGGHD